MKSFRHIAVTALLTIGVFTTVTYTSCTRDDCKEVSCQHGGSCVGGACACPTGYEGSRCETLSGLKFVANWRTTTESCNISGSNAQYDIGVTQSSTNAATLLINNLYNGGKIVTATLTSANTFTIDSQDFGSSGTISGSGVINGAQITISYVVTVGPASDVCNNVVFIKL